MRKSSPTSLSLNPYEIDIQRRKRNHQKYRNIFKLYEETENLLASEDLMPGPGEYSGVVKYNTSIGNQRVSSKYMSGPSFSITAKNQRGWSKKFISKSHSADVLGTATTDASLFMLPDIEKTKPCKNRGMPFPMSKRRDLATLLIGATSIRAVAEASPGSMAYNVSEKHCKDLSTFDYKGIRMDKGPRFIDTSNRPSLKASESTGPGSYRLPSTLRTDTGRTFPHGFSAYRKVLIPGNSGTQKGVFGAGPGDPLWRDVIKDASKEGCSWYKANRWGPRPYTETVPGPGKYDTIKTCLIKKEKNPFARETNSKLSDVRNPPTCLFGKPPKKGRLNYRELAKA